MKQTLINTKIRSFCLTPNGIVYPTTEEKIYLEKECVYESNDNCQEIYYKGVNAYTNTIYGDGIEINLEKKKVEYYKNTFIKYLDSDYRITSERKNTVIQYKKEKTITLKPYRIFIYLLEKQSKKLIAYRGNNLTGTNLNIIATSLVSNTDFFIFSLALLGARFDGQTEKPYQVSEFCDIYKNTLISTMTNGDILLLDIEKGQEFKLLKNTRIKGGLFQKEQNSPIYIGLKFKTYIELNVEKGEIIQQIDLEEYFKQKFNRPIITPINTTIYKNGLIYFIADTNIVGIFNPDKLEVIDYYEFQFKNWQIMLKGGKENLQVKDNKIYCLDNQNNLYIIEYYTIS